MQVCNVPTVAAGLPPMSTVGTPGPAIDAGMPSRVAHPRGGWHDAFPLP